MGNGLIAAAGGPEELIGTVTFTGIFEDSPLFIPIHFFVADTLYMPEWDTVYCDDGSKAYALALAVGNNGNIGLKGEGHVNLDYFDYGDCAWWDERWEVNPYLGDARVYLYDGSPIICWDDGGTIKADYSMFDVDFATRTGNVRGFFPMHEPIQDYPSWMTPNGTPDASLHVTEFVNRDTTIKIEQVTIAPNVEDPHFVIQAVKYTNLTGYDITDLAIGEALDWDIPSDSGNWNGSGHDVSRHLMYQVGEEYVQDAVQCQPNDDRYGGLAVLEIFEDGVSSDPEWGVYAMDNATQVYPTGRFVPDSLWKCMQANVGFTSADSMQYNDLHTVATYRWNHTLDAGGGSLIVYTFKLTAYGVSSESGLTALANEAVAWYELNFTPAGAWGRCCYGDHQCSVERQAYCVDLNGGWTAGLDCTTPCPDTCCRYVGDIRHDGVDGDPSSGIPLIDDLVYMVTFMFQNDQACGMMCDDNPAEGCSSDLTASFPEANINGEGIDFPFIDDLVYMVTYMFQDGPPPAGWIPDPSDPEAPWLPACDR